MDIQYPTDEAALRTLIETHAIVVFDLYSEDCPPCARLAPIFERVAQGFPTVTFAKMHRQEHRALAEEYHIFGSPTVLFFRRTRLQPVRLTGVIEEDVLRAEVGRLLASEDASSAPASEEPSGERHAHGDDAEAPDQREPR